MKKNISFLLILQFSFFTSSLVFANDQIEVSNSWIREAPPSVRVSVAYMLLRNNSNQPQKLLSVSSLDFHNIELHKTSNKDGMMLMEQQSELNIPAKEHIELKPNGYHLMMMGRKRELLEGDKVKMTLSFSDGNKLTISVPIQKNAPKKIN